MFIGSSWVITLSDGQTSCIAINHGDEVRLDTMRVSQLDVQKGIIFHTLVIRSDRAAYRLPGLSNSGIRKAIEKIKKHIHKHLTGLIDSDLPSLSYVDNKISSLLEEKHRYISKNDVFNVLNERHSPLVKALTHPLFEIDYLPLKISSKLPASIVNISKDHERQKYNEDFVRSESVAYKSFFDKVVKNSLSDEQREACIRMEDNNLLIACAGSGKTSTLIAKILYLLAKGIYVQSEIIILAFNRDAAKEINVRLAEELQEDVNKISIKSTTFHAFGLDVIKSSSDAPVSLANWVESPISEAKLLNQLIDELVKTDTSFSEDWFDLLSIYPECNAKDNSAESQTDLKQTLSNLNVRSLEEQTIANWLHTHKVKFEYEKAFKIEYSDDDDTWRFQANQKPQEYIYPDFYYPEIDTWHEHFGLDERGRAPEFLGDDYVRIAEIKRDGFLKSETNFFETRSADNKRNVLVKVLEKELTKRGLKCQRMTNAEILDSIDNTIVKKYHRLLSTCIKHIRANGLTLEMLTRKSEELSYPVRAQVFSRVAIKVADAYSKTLENTNTLDFDDMITKATTLIENGKYKSNYSLILVDEFQDISVPRANFVKALKARNNDTKVFAVGDDFQAIYRFAGSDITIFTKFMSHFGNGWQGALTKTFRSNQLIAKTASDFIKKNPEQISKTVNSIHKLIPKSLRAIPFNPYTNNDNLERCARTLLERLNNFARHNESAWKTDSKSQLTILILSRYAFTNPFKQKQLPTFSHLKIQCMTFHKSKGLEADYAILSDISEGTYGVPSTIEDDELLQLVIPEPEKYPLAEERRLFYVAMTRAKKAVYLLYQEDKPSRYINEIKELSGNNLCFETGRGQPINFCPKCSNGQLKLRKNQRGVSFLGCSNYPNCNHSEGFIP